MSKKTEGTEVQEQTNEKVKQSRHPAEMEADRLSIELNLEKTKVDALSRRCIQLGEELDAAIIAEENRTEQEMFNRINCRYYHQKAVAIDNRRQNARAKKMAAFYRKALKTNAGFLGGEVLVTLIAILFGATNVVHPILAVILAGVMLMAFGWSLNTCVYLLGRCEQ